MNKAKRCGINLDSPSTKSTRAESRLGDKVSLVVNGLNPALRWILLATTIGAVAGLGAVVFYEALSVATTIFLTRFAHYQVPLPNGEGNLVGSRRFLEPYLIPIATTVGGLLSGILVFSLAPEAEGHGTDAAISASHQGPWSVRVRVVLVKIVASALTIGSGGSGGREGPTGQISAGFGSFIARTLRLSPRDSQIAVAVGVGSGIGAIFGAPLGGAILAGEILYSSDIDATAILPALLASTVAYGIFGSILGYRPLFGFVSTGASVSSKYLWIFLLAGLLYGGMGVLYAKVFYGAISLFHRLHIPRFIKPALGGALVGVIALSIPQVLGTGYGWIQLTFSNALSATPLIVILAIPFLRILATSLSIGSGGSGGIFGPGMVIGAFTGYAFWRVTESILPVQLAHDPGIFIIGAMAATFGSVARAPIAVTVMVFEMTGNFNTVETTSLSVVCASLVVALAKAKIYEKQLPDRSFSIPSRVYSLMARPIKLSSLQTTSQRTSVTSTYNETGPAKAREIVFPETVDLREAILAKLLLGIESIRLISSTSSYSVSYQEVVSSWVRSHNASIASLVEDGELKESLAYPPSSKTTPLLLPIAARRNGSNIYQPATAYLNPKDTLIYLDLSDKVE